jgi:hypothetical protein
MHMVGLEDSDWPLKALQFIHSTKECFENPPLRLAELRHAQKRMSLQRWTRGKDKFPFQQVLSTSFVSDCGLPEDRIYAFLGLIPEDSWDGLSIDYERPTSDTFTQATWAMIKSTQSLRILSFVEDRSLRKVPQLPSWVPDYSALRTQSALDPGNNTRFAGFAATPYNSAKETQFNKTIVDMLSRDLVVSAVFSAVFKRSNP